MSFVYHIYTVPETAHYFGYESVQGSRFRQEIQAALNGRDVQPRLMRWLRKYLLSMEHEVIIESIRVPQGDNWQDHERFIIWLGRQIFGRDKVCNIVDGGQGVTKGSKLGKHRRPRSSEHRAKLAVNKGRSWSSEVRRKMSEGMRKYRQDNRTDTYLQCWTCDDIFWVIPSHWTSGRKKYCSKQCFYGRSV